MRKFLFAAPLALAAASVLAVPASAAPYVHNAGKLRGEIAQLDRQIDRAEQRRLLSRQEASRLERQVDQLRDQHARFARGGFSRAELRILDQRIGMLKRQLSREIADRDRHRW